MPFCVCTLLNIHYRMDIEVDLLITLVQERPVLWDKSLEDYKYKNLKLKSWEEICGILNNDYENFEKTNKKKYDWSSGNNNIPVVGEDVKVMSLQPSEANLTEGMACYERPLLEQQLRLTKANEGGSRDVNVPNEGRDYSPSCSSWAPSDDESSSDESDKEKETRRIKMQQHIGHYTKRRHGKSVPIPVHRPNAVVNVLKERQHNINNRTNNRSRKRKYKETRTGNKSLPDSTKKHLPPPKTSVETISVNKKNILDMKASFDELFKIINDMKPESERRTSKYFDSSTAVQQVPIKEDTMNAPVYNNTEAYEECEKSQSEESNRSDDNVLISNKYSKVREVAEDQHKKTSKQQHNAALDEVDEWVPIGSGKTLIHKDKFSKVNWRSYTIATRTLLLATFPRRILATHSLTGKRSPAFQDKPAKMCLDPKIVSDIIIEITSKFNVKENLVRSAITTKCADECKMLKTRTIQKKKLKNQENTAPPMNPKTEPRQVKTEQIKLTQEY